MITSYWIMLMVFGVAIMLSPSWLVVVLAFALLYVGVFWEEIYEGVVSWLRRNN